MRVWIRRWMRVTRWSLDPATFTDAGHVGHAYGRRSIGVTGRSSRAPWTRSAAARCPGRHVYADDGVYTVTVTVTDDDGGVEVGHVHGDGRPMWRRWLMRVSIRRWMRATRWSLDPATFTDAGFVGYAYGRRSIGVTARSSRCEHRGPVDQPAGTVSGSHVYADDGVYTVTVTVTDDDGGVAVGHVHGDGRQCGSDG